MNKNFMMTNLFVCFVLFTTSIFAQNSVCPLPENNRHNYTKKNKRSNNQNKRSNKHNKNKTNKIAARPIVERSSLYVLSLEKDIKPYLKNDKKKDMAIITIPVSKAEKKNLLVNIKNDTGFEVKLKVARILALPENKIYKTKYYLDTKKNNEILLDKPGLTGETLQYVSVYEIPIIPGSDDTTPIFLGKFLIRYTEKQ